MNRTPIYFLASAAFVALVCGAARPAPAQVPFFGRGATIFDPEIGVVQSGIVNDVQATVSADRKYVTMTMRATNAQLLALHEFTFQAGNGGVPGGFVGGAGGGGAAANGGANGGGNGAANGGGGNRAARARGGAPGRAQPPAAAAPRAPSVLDRPGMTMLGRAPAGRARRD